jgi:hypothetical protein
MAQGNNPPNPPANDHDGKPDKTAEFSGGIKKFETFAFRYYRLKDDPEKRKQQIQELLDKANDIGTHLYIGYPFEAKNAPFRRRVAAVKELALA